MMEPNIPWSEQLRYLGIFIKAGQQFRCDYSACKLSFIRSANSLLAKLGRYASEEVILALLSAKCLPALLYGLEACPVLPSDLSSLDFVVRRFIFKLFRTSSNQIVDEVINMCNIRLPSSTIPARTKRFVDAVQLSDNFLCNVYT